jgi:hypothetical protein
MLEADVKPKILKYLNSLPRSYFQVTLPGAEAGDGDIFGCLNGRYVRFEVKRPGGRKMGKRQGEKLQLYKLQKLAMAGAVTAVVRSVDEARTALLHAGLL